MWSMKREARKMKPLPAQGRLPAVPPPKKGLVLAGFRLRPDQLEALRREAFRRAEERGSRKPDASELLREALDAWLAKATKAKR